MSNPSRFLDLTQDPPIEVFELTRQFNEDSHPNKVNLGVGCKWLLLVWKIFFLYLILFFFQAYKDDNGKPWVLPIVRTVEQQLANDMTLNHEYLPVLGLGEFSNAAVKLILGNDSLSVINNLVNWLIYLI